jgi:hypothetical protein
MASRATTDEPWGPAVSLDASDIPTGASLCFSADGLSLYFESFFLGGYGQADLFVSTRATIDAPWSDPVNLGPNVNSSALDMGSTVSSDGLSLFFQSTRAGGFGAEDIYVCTRATTSDLWRPAENLGANVNSSFVDGQPFVLSDGLTLLFCSDRSGGYGDWDIWVTKRNSKDDEWGTAVNLGPSINTEFGEAEPFISPDGKEIYFSDWWTPHPGGVGTMDLWQAPIIRVVDFNSDGKIDLKDYSRLAQYWQQNEPSVDMAPTPLGDGVVDIQDAAVVAEYWLTEPGLVAHWKLDETEGYMAHDSAGDHDAFVIGPIWQPTNGKVDGALEFDGIDDHVGTPFVLNPAQGSFSVFLWVKGDVPGQVILSQAGGVNWFYTLSPMGWLMSHLGGTLLSQTVVTDGQWHRIGFTWDGTKRILYVDGVNVAEGTPAGLAASQGGLHLGAGKDLDTGSFLSGLVDDVKIYNRTIVP